MAAISRNSPGLPVGTKLGTNFFWWPPVGYPGRQKTPGVLQIANVIFLQRPNFIGIFNSTPVNSLDLRPAVTESSCIDQLHPEHRPLERYDLRCQKRRGVVPL